MKRLKLVVFTAILVVTSLHIEATADLMINQPEINRLKPYLETEKNHQDGKIVRLGTSGQHDLEVKTTDEPDTMTWDAAVIAVQKHGAGWRLPTITELNVIYEQRKLIGEFSDEDYWSSTERDINSAWIQGFRVGDQDRYIKHSKLKVRAVRSF